MAPLALFPLPMVLFPGTVELLHIFEPRYRAMLADCLAADRRFGVICCDKGMAEGAIAVGTLGTVAHIETVQHLDDGRSNIAIRGLERFRFRGYQTTNLAYRVGEVEPCEATREHVDAPTLRRLGALFDRAVTASRRLVGDRGPLPDLPAADEARTFAMAQFLELSLATRQELLATTDAEARAERLIGLLVELLPALEERAATRERAQSNGHGHL